MWLCKFLQKNNQILSLLFSILFCCNNSYATSVLSVDFSEMLNNSEFIFEGRAINIETIRGDNFNEIKTEVEFEILDIIKGEYPSTTIRLQFAGGTIDGITLKISGMHYPALGETGIYFVETLSDNLVHPFYGWSQGHFRVTEDDAVTTQGCMSSKPFGLRAV